MVSQADVMRVLDGLGGIKEGTCEVCGCDDEELMQFGPENSWACFECCIPREEEIVKAAARIILQRDLTPGELFQFLVESPMSEISKHSSDS